MTNKILTHICLVYGRPLPGRLQSEALQRLINIKTVQDMDIKQNRKQRNRSGNSDLITLLKLLKVQIPVDKSESEVMTMCKKLRSRSIHKVLTSKMRRRVKLGKLRSNKRNAPTLDFVKKRKANVEIDSNHAGGKSKKHCLEKPLKSKRLNVQKMEPK